MFARLFKKKKAPEPHHEAEHGPFTLESWRANGNEVNGNSFADTAKARGRYEIAEQFHLMGTDWYEANVVNGRPHPGDTAEQRARFAEHLAELRAYTPEFAQLVATRQKLIHALAAHPDGIDRDELKKHVGHSGKTTWGVICNQLARGGFLLQAQEGKRHILRPASTPPISNQDFLATEIPAPGTSGLHAP